ncbi:hypothetical protein BDW62DRAFT_209592 [Aspergillus aurantiobrunneus]
MQLHHLLIGSYTNTTLFLLAFDSVSRTLSLNLTIPGYGLHQFVTSNAAKNRIYATTMSEPPRLFSWSIDEEFRFNHLDTINTTSSACYRSDNGQYTFSAGGPTAHIHALDQDGGISQLIDEIDFLPSEVIERVDKTRNAVLYGAHAFDINVNNKASIPDLGMKSIYMYDIAANGSVTLLSINLSPTDVDGPRNTHPTQWLDVYEIGNTQLRHIQRGSAIPDNVRGEFTFRGNTVQPSRDGRYLFTSSRSWNSPGANGYVAAFALNETGYLAEERALTFYEAPVSLGSAGGLRVALWTDKSNCDPNSLPDYMYLSDTSEGWMFILGWSPSDTSLDLVASYRYIENTTPYEATWLD